MLLLHKRAGSNRFATFLWAVAVALLLRVVIFLLHSGFVLSQDMMISSIFYAVSILTVLLSLVFAALSCRKYFSPVRFTLWLAVCTPVSSILLMFVYALIALGIMAFSSGSLPTYWLPVFLRVLVVGLVFGLILYAVELPFAILAFSSAFFKKRFYECFRLKGMDADIEKPPATGPDNVIFIDAKQKYPDSDDKVSNKWQDPPQPKD